ncbi:hypothetical protein [Pseudomonas sp. PB3P13]
MQTCHLFISHSWNNATKHDRLIEMLTDNTKSTVNAIEQHTAV